MIELTQEDIRFEDRPSSKGNQMKFIKDGVWFKADYCGYEGLSEYVISKLLAYTGLNEKEYVNYETTKIKYKETIFNGCRSKDFLEKGNSLITLERLFTQFYGESLTKAIYHIPDEAKRLEFAVDQVIRITGLTDFGAYMSKMLTVDAFFLNEDRHMHNIAVILRSDGTYDYAPIFDNGAALLSDTMLDYPLTMDLYKAIDSAKSKTFSRNFEDQLEIAEKLYGQKLKFTFSKKTVDDILNKDDVYSGDVKERVYNCIAERIRVFSYLFG